MLVRIHLRTHLCRCANGWADSCCYRESRLYGAHSSARRALQDAKECVAYDEPDQALETAERAIMLAIAFRDSIAERIAEGEQFFWAADRQRRQSYRRAAKRSEQFARRIR